MSEPAPSAQSITASFRDPAGSLFRYQGRVLRVVNAIGAADLEAFLASQSGRKLMAAGTVVPTRALDAAECRALLADPSVRQLYEARGGQMILEHERVDFPSFPYEWNAEMLHAAGLLTLDLAQALLADGLGLKDGTPYNILFRGPAPVFIDVLSFERRQPGDATWLPYAQFVRTFLLPLLANQAYGLGLDQILTTRRDGLEPEEVYRWSKPSQRLRPPFFSLVSMPTWLGGKHKQEDNSIYQKKLLSDPEKARYILDHMLNGLRITLRRLKPAEGKSSVWSDYMSTNNNYTADHFQAKQRFVGDALAEFPSRSVLDVGCNTGHFSAIAARHGAKVVALDYDPVVLGDVWRNARKENLEILPLAVNVTRPSPGTGWRNQECSSFLDRARGKFDAVLMLAVIHHMLVTERVPLADILDLAAELTTNLLVIEFVAPDDSMFQRLTRGREELHKDLTPELFESLCRRHFEIVRVQYVEGTTRRLYLLQEASLIGAMRHTFLIALSFANICYLRVWGEILTYRPWDTYLMATPPRPVEYLALVVNILLVAAALTGLSILARRLLPGKQFRFAEMAVVLGIFIPLNAVRAVLSNRYPLLRSPLIELLGLRGVMILGACLAIGGLIAIVYFHHRIAVAITAALAVLSPFCAVTFGQAAWKAAHYDASAYRNRPQVPRIAGTGKSPRVLWVIADEWDYRLTFVDRNPALQLPEIDRLLGTSLYADNAYPPGLETPISIPGYYSGKLVEHVRHDGARELQVAYHDDRRGEVPWSVQSSVFERARTLGVNTALLEWYHPTCRVLNSLTYCKWWPMAMQHNSMGDSFWQILPNQTRSLFESNLFSLFGRSLTAKQQTGVYQAMMGEAKRLVVDRDLGFILVHLPIPHAPHAYDRKTGTFTLGNSPIAGYIDSLALLDRSVGELRRVMESAGVWDSTTVLFTSDHGYRDSEALDGKSDSRIPYILKLASQKDGVKYTQEFNTVLTADLLLGVLHGEIGDPASAVAWLDRNRTRRLK